MKKEPPGGIALTSIRIGLSMRSAPAWLLSTRHAPPRTPRSGFTGCAVRPHRARNFLTCFMRRPRPRRPHPFHVRPHALAPASGADRTVPYARSLLTRSMRCSPATIPRASRPTVPAHCLHPLGLKAPLARVRHRIRFRLREHLRDSQCCALRGATLRAPTLPNRLHRHAPLQTSDNCPGPASRRKPKGPSP